MMQESRNEKKEKKATKSRSKTMCSFSRVMVFVLFPVFCSVLTQGAARPPLSCRLSGVLPLVFLFLPTRWKRKTQRTRRGQWRGGDGARHQRTPAPIPQQPPPPPPTKAARPPNALLFLLSPLANQPTIHRPLTYATCKPTSALATNDDLSLSLAFASPTDQPTNHVYV